MHVAEVAHIVAASDNGPRANVNLDSEFRRSYNNLLILCPTCHTIVDKAPEKHPCHQLMQWKRDHTLKVMKAFSITCYDSREDARRAIDPLMEENFHIFKRFGPNNEYRFDPESEYAQVWKRKVLSSILPNNRRILLTLDKNRTLLAPDEKWVFEEFRQHVMDMEERHLGNLSTIGQQFPPRMREILVGEA